MGCSFQPYGPSHKPKPTLDARLTIISTAKFRRESCAFDKVCELVGCNVLHFWSGQRERLMAIRDYCREESFTVFIDD